MVVIVPHALRGSGRRPGRRAGAKITTRCAFVSDRVIDIDGKSRFAVVVLPPREDVPAPAGYWLVNRRI